MSVAIVSILLVGNWRFQYQDKAKTLSLCLAILQLDYAKIRFLLNNATLF